MIAWERVRVNGIEVAYADLGPEREPAGPVTAAPVTAAPGTTAPGRKEGVPLVLVHGFTGHRDDFAEVLPALARERRCLAPDLRGHGDSGRAGRPRGYDFPTLVDDLAGFLDRLGIAACHLLGHSMGGMVVLRFALAHPQRVASLILMNTSAAAPEGFSREVLEIAAGLARERGMEELQRRVEARGREEGGAAALEGPEGEEDDEGYWLHHRRRYAAMDPEAYAALGMAMLDQESVEARLGEIDCPATVLVGDGDGPFVPAAALLATGIPGARQVVIPGAGHHPHRDERAAWLTAVEAHLARLT